MRYIGTIIALVCGAYFTYYINQYISGLPAIKWDLRAISLFLASIMGYLLAIILGGVNWDILLKNYRSSINWYHAQVIFSLAQIAKYLPGNVGHHVGRVLLARDQGIPVKITIQTMLMETAWSIAVAASLTLLTSLFFIIPANAQGIAINLISVVLMFIGTLFLPLLAIKFVNVYLPKLAAKLSGESLLVVPSLSTLVKVSLIYLTCFLIVGILIDLQARFLFDHPESRILLLTGIFASSWIAGYLTPGAPAGLGVREAVLVSALTPIYGGGVAVGLSLSLRVVTTLGDGLAFLVALVVKRWIQ